MTLISSGVLYSTSCAVAMRCNNNIYLGLYTQLSNPLMSDHFSLWQEGRTRGWQWSPMTKWRLWGRGKKGEHREAGQRTLWGREDEEK